MSFLEILRFLPGFRFSPTDEQLVSYYLRKKVCGRVLPFEVIAEIDLYNYEPWDLPEKSALPSRDREWYFFIPRDRKYPNGNRAKRGTSKGYWKSTGKDRSVYSSARAMGTKKTLVYYNGRAPKGERTNWVMHEYRLNDVECQRIHAAENGFVLCRVHQKSGVGPKNGEQYGAPVKDEDFEELPTVELDASGSLKPSLFEGGPCNTSVYFGESITSGCENDAVCYGVDIKNGHIPCSGFEPRSLNAHFVQSHGDFQEQNLTRSAIGGSVFSANGELVDSAVVAPLTLEEEEAEMLEQILGECDGCLVSREGSQDTATSVDNGYFQSGEHPPSDGDFLEINDLFDSEEGNVFTKDNEKKASIESRDYSGESQCSLMQALPMFDANAQWQSLLFGDGVCQGYQMIPEVMQTQSSVSTVTYDSQHQPFRNNVLGSFPLPSELGSAGHTGSVEPEDENVWKFYDHLIARADENNLRQWFESEDNSASPLQDGPLFDAISSFTDIDVSGECIHTNLQARYGNGIPQVALAQASLASEVDEALDELGHPDKVLQAKDLVDESSGLSQSEALCLEQGRHSPRSLGLFVRWISSFPTLPASAAELSPRATSPGRSIQITATGVGVRGVSVTCTCIGEGIPSSCVNCSVAEVEKKGRFLKSMSFVGQRKKSPDRWNRAVFVSAVFGGLFAVFVGVLVTTGAWKALGGVYKFVIASQT